MGRNESIKFVIFGMIFILLGTCYCKEEVKGGGVIHDCCTRCFEQCREMFGYVNEICLRNCQRGCPIYCPPFQTKGYCSSESIHTHTNLHAYAHTNEV